MQSLDVFSHEIGSAKNTSGDLPRWQGEKVMVMGSNDLPALRCLVGSCEGHTFTYDLENQCSDIIYEVN